VDFPTEIRKGETGCRQISKEAEGKTKDYIKYREEKEGLGQSTLTSWASETNWPERLGGYRDLEEKVDGMVLFIAAIGGLRLNSSTTLISESGLEGEVLSLVK